MYTKASKANVTGISTLGMKTPRVQFTAWTRDKEGSQTAYTQSISLIRGTLKFQSYIFTRDTLHAD